jgi:hypothetical protein
LGPLFDQLVVSPQTIILRIGKSFQPTLYPQEA